MLVYVSLVWVRGSLVWVRGSLVLDSGKHVNAGQFLLCRGRRMRYKGTWGEIIGVVNHRSSLEEVQYGCLRGSRRASEIQADAVREVVKQQASYHGHCSQRSIKDGLVTRKVTQDSSGYLFWVCHVSYLLNVVD